MLKKFADKTREYGKTALKLSIAAQILAACSQNIQTPTKTAIQQITPPKQQVCMKKPTESFKLGRKYNNIIKGATKEFGWTQNELVGEKSKRARTLFANIAGKKLRIGTQIINPESGKLCFTEADFPMIEWAMIKIVLENPFYLRQLEKSPMTTNETRVFLQSFAKNVIKFRLSPYKMFAILIVESNLRPNAVSRNAKGKIIGARTMWQIMPNTAAYYGESIDELAQNIAKSTDIGMTHFAKGFKTFNGNYNLALAAYNKGIHGIAGFLIDQHGGEKWEKKKKELENKVKHKKNRETEFAVLRTRYFRYLIRSDPHFAKIIAEYDAEKINATNHGGIPKETREYALKNKNILQKANISAARKKIRNKNTK